jgi:hypothetical protein
MTVQPMPAPEQAKPKSNLGRILLIIVGVIAVLCVIVIAVYFLVLVPQMEAVNLGIVCSLMDNSAEADDCSNWAQEVLQEHREDFDECRAVTDTYGCLVDRGLGPDDLR